MFKHILVFKMHFNIFFTVDRVTLHDNWFPKVLERFFYSKFPKFELIKWCSNAHFQDGGLKILNFEMLWNVA